MKKVYCFTAVLLLAAGLFAQTGAHTLMSIRHDIYQNSAWIIKDSVRNTYNGDTLLALANRMTYDAGTWKPATRQTRTYNPDGYMLTETEEVYVNHLSIWRNDKKHTNVLNNDNYTLESLDQKWDTVNNAWRNSSRFIITYDGQNRTTERIGQNWSIVNNSWLNIYKYDTYTYDANNNELGRTSQSWVSNAWVNNGQHVYTYDANNNPLTVLNKKWISGSWVNDSRGEYTFDVNDNNTSYLVYDWNAGSSSWVNVMRQTNTFNSSNSVTQVLYETWLSNAWAPEAKYEHTYNADNNETLEENFNYINNAWVPVYHFVNTFNADKERDYRLYEWYDTATAAYKPKDRFYYYWEDFNPAALHELKNELQAGIYPNPANGERAVLTFNTTTATSVVVNVYNLQGRLLVQQTTPTHSGANQIPLATESLTTGTYYVQVVDVANGESSTLKAIW